MNIAIIGDTHLAKTMGSRTDNNYMETCLNKLEQVLSQNDYVLCLGDFFNTAVADTDLVGSVYSLLKSYKQTELITIIGNHCCYNMNEDSLYRTSLGLLELTGAIKVLRPKDYFEVGEGLCFKTLPLNFKDIKPDNDECFFLGHHYFGLNCADSLSEDMLKEYFPNAQGLAFGHEHQPFPITEINLNKTVNIYRPGSLLRNAATDYNKKRKPFYYQITLEEWKQGLPFRMVQLECAEGKDIFVDNIVIKKREKFLENVDRVIQLCSEKVDTETKYSMIETLKEIKTPRRCFEYIIKTCKTLNVNIK